MMNPFCSNCKELIEDCRCDWSENYIIIANKKVLKADYFYAELICDECGHTISEHNNVCMKESCDCVSDQDSIQLLKAREIIRLKNKIKVLEEDKEMLLEDIQRLKTELKLL